jgi:hypothetical protein
VVDSGLRLWVSRDAGATWCPTEEVFADEVRVDPHDPRGLYAVSDWGGVSHSDDDGATWTFSWFPTYQALSDSPFEGERFVVDPAVPDRLWVLGIEYYGLQYSIQRSDDAGDQFEEVVLPRGEPAGVFADPTDGGIYAYTFDRELWRTRSGGAEWELVRTGLTPAWPIFSVDAAGRVWFADDVGDLRVVDPATGMDRIVSVPGAAHSVRNDTSDPEHLFVWTEQEDLHESFDGGETWALVGPACPALPEGGQDRWWCVVSGDLGRVGPWRPVTGTLSLSTAGAGPAASLLVVPPDRPHELYVPQSDHVALSLDRGASFCPIEGRLLALDDEGILYAFGDVRARRTADGRTWDWIPTLDGLERLVGGEVLLAQAADGPVYSSSGGVSWDKVDRPRELRDAELPVATFGGKVLLTDPQNTFLAAGPPDTEQGWWSVPLEPCGGWSTVTFARLGDDLLAVGCPPDEPAHLVAIALDGTVREIELPVVPQSVTTVGSRVLLQTSTELGWYGPEGWDPLSLEVPIQGEGPVPTLYVGGTGDLLFGIQGSTGLLRASLER